MVSFRIFDNYLSIAIISLNAILIAAAPSELKLVNVVFRHGDRTPDNNGREMFPNDPYINYSFYPTGLGQLTIEGKKHEYRLGKFLRSRYNDFLGSLYAPKLIAASSSDFERTKMSLQLVLASLFPPRNVQRWNPILNWQPIPTSYIPRIDDNIILADECPQYLEEYNRILNSPEGQAKIGQFKDLMGNLTKLTGKKIETLEDLYFLYQTFIAESSLGLPLPEWAYDYFPYGQLFDGIVASYNISNFTPLIRRLYAGPMIRAMTDNMIAAQNPSAAPNTKVYLYSGHETNIAGMLHAFGVYKPHVPEYSSAVILELQQIEQEYYVKLFRHGDRTLSNENEMYPNDPYLNYSFYPEGLGQLTNRGKMREYELGQVLHKRYKNFLGNLYLPKLVVGRSSDYDRTKMSLQLVLASLFPPINVRQRWNLALNWQPIPATYVPRIDDNFFTSHECPQYLNEYNRVLNLPKTLEKMSQFTDLMDKLTKLTGKKIEKPWDMFYLYHTFLAESSMNLPLPKWAYDYFPDGPLFDGIVAAYNIANSTSLLRRLYTGPIIRAISENMLAVRNTSASNTKIYLYSGHEINIALLLHAFNVYKPHVPEYSSAIILELLKQNDQYFVKLLYYRGIPPIIDELTISGCETLCSFDKFSDLIRDLIPSDKEMACDKRQTSDYEDTKYPADLENIVYNLIKRSIEADNNT